MHDTSRARSLNFYSSSALASKPSRKGNDYGWIVQESAREGVISPATVGDGRIGQNPVYVVVYFYGRISRDLTSHSRFSPPKF